MIIIGVHKKGEFWENYEKAYFDVGFIASYDPARGIVILTLSKTEHHRQQQASNNKALAKSEQQNEHLTAYGSLQKPNTQQQTKPHYMGYWWEPNSKPNTQAER